MVNMKKERIQREIYTSVVYSDDHWELLKSKRKRAIELLEMFSNEYI